MRRTTLVGVLTTITTWLSGTWKGTTAGGSSPRWPPV